MKTFQVGDRVSVSGPGWDTILEKYIEPVEEKWTGTVNGIDHNYITVAVDRWKPGNKPLWVYPGQCRKLVKRKPRDQSKFYGAKSDLPESAPIREPISVVVETPDRVIDITPWLVAVMVVASVGLVLVGLVSMLAWLGVST